VVTIPILVEIVGASVANGANRIAILMQNLVGAAGFQRGKAIPWSEVWPPAPRSSWEHSAERTWPSPFLRKQCGGCSRSWWCW